MLQGFAYIPSSNEMIASIVCNKFRARLSEELVVSRGIVTDAIGLALAYLS